jgi:carotenoid cleavage dioxygenase-like enzyme
MTNTITQPSYVTGVRAPVSDEIDAVDLNVTGTLPSELSGRYFRNGANPPPGTDPGHWFTGHGMLHGVRIRDGRAHWYRNRWMRTQRVPGEPLDWTAEPEEILLSNISNTSVLHHGGRTLALAEFGLPYEVDGDLETVGPWDFRGKLKTAMTAHPKVDPVTGDLYFYGVGPNPPYLTFYRVNVAGELVRSVPITVPACTMMHDFAITARHAVFLDLPVVFDPSLTTRPGMPFRWSDAYAPRIGVMPLDGGDADVTWIDVEPSYAFHVANARETDAGTIVIDSVDYDPASFNSAWRNLGGESTLSESLLTTATGGHLHRWTLDPAAGTAREERLDDLAIEYPTINDSRVGRASNAVYAVSSPRMSSRHLPTIVKFDTQGGGRSAYVVDEGWIPGEAEFVPAEGGTREDDGWLMSIVTHQTRDAARLIVLDAGNVTAGPVATVELPRRVPIGFHGNWIPDGPGVA